MAGFLSCLEMGLNMLRWLKVVVVCGADNSDSFGLDKVLELIYLTSNLAFVIRGFFSGISTFVMIKCVGLFILSLYSTDVEYP